MKIPSRTHLFSPRNLFALDAIGASLTALLLTMMIGSFEEIFGMPKRPTIYLTIVAGLFAVYSFSCYFLNPRNWQVYMRVIMIANLLYCCLTLALMLIYFKQLTTWGIIYFTAEIIIIFVLISIEYRLSRGKRS